MTKQYIYQQILKNKATTKKMLAVLLDPDKCQGDLLIKVLEQLKIATPDFIFIGGSSKTCNCHTLLDKLQSINAPKILFPGDASQFSPQADALLFLSLISGRNPDYLIEQHVKSAFEIKNSNVEAIPTGYILIDGGTNSAVKTVSKTEPIEADDIGKAVSTALAGELLGMKMIYLEAGSGAKIPVSEEMISKVKSAIDVPLIVGGGVRDLEQLEKTFTAGADLVVVGNVFESETEKLEKFIRWLKG